MRNPYIVGSVVRHPYFYGRQGLIEDLLDKRHQCIYLIGNRRTGKTSVLNYLEEHALVIPLFLNLQSTKGDPVVMGTKLAREVNRKAKDIAAFKHADLKAGRDICEVVEILSETAEDGGFTILLLWDEGEELLSLDKACLKRLRSALQDKRSIRIILTASKRLSELNDRCRSWKTSPFLHGFSIRYIPPLSRQEAIELMCQVNNPQGMVEVEEGLQQQIVEVTGNHPYLMQHLCYRLFQQDGKLQPIGEWDLVVDGQLSAFFQSDYDTLSHSERTILRVLADSELGTVTEIQLRHALRIRRDSLRSYLFGLELLGYIRRLDDCWQIANHFLRTWLSMGRVEETPEVVSDEASLEVSAMALDPASHSDEQVTVGLHQKAMLVDALLSCSTMNDRGARDTVVGDLPSNIRSAIKRHSIDRVDVANIVTVCSGFPEGIQKLIEIVRFYEGDSFGMRNVDETLIG